MALLASVGTLALIWRCARAARAEPRVAILLVGANPLYVIYGLGGAHNDLIMLLLMMAAVSLTFAGRDASAAAAVVAGALVKATVAVLLPFMILARRSRAQVLGAAAALGRGCADRLRRVRHARNRRGRGAQPRRRVRLDRQLPHRDRPPVRQAGGVPGRPRPAQGGARADRAAPAVAHLARL